MNEGQQKIASYRFELSPAESNGQREIPFTLLVKRILETATYHAESWSVGYSNLIGMNQGWVLARLAIEMTSYPRIHDGYIVETWIESYNRHFSARNFCFKRADGMVYGYARSIWSVIDLGTRTSVDLTTFGHLDRNVSEKECPIAPQSKIRPVKDEHPFIYPVRYSDIDLNRHVNSVKYIEHMLDYFPFGKYDGEMIKRFEINYISEACYGEEMSMACEELSENDYTLEITNTEKGSICRGRIGFEPRTETMK